jgi:hypothetical protein
MVAQAVETISQKFQAHQAKVTAGHVYTSIPCYLNLEDVQALQRVRVGESHEAIPDFQVDFLPKKINYGYLFIDDRLNVVSGVMVEKPLQEEKNAFHVLVELIGVE